MTNETSVRATLAIGSKSDDLTQKFKRALNEVCNNEYTMGEWETLTFEGVRHVFKTKRGTGEFEAEIPGLWHTMKNFKNKENPGLVIPNFGYIPQSSLKALGIKKTPEQNAKSYRITNDLNMLYIIEHLLDNGFNVTEARTLIHDVHPDLSRKRILEIQNAYKEHYEDKITGNYPKVFIDEIQENLLMETTQSESIIDYHESLSHGGFIDEINSSIENGKEEVNFATYVPEFNSLTKSRKVEAANRDHTLKNMSSLF